MVKRKHRPPLFSGDGLRAAGAAAGKLVGILGLVGSLWQGWQAGRKAEGADARAGAVAAYAVNVGAERDTLAGRMAWLSKRVARLEKRVSSLQRKTIPGEAVVYGPEEAPAGYKPESHGLLWHALHPFGR